MGALIDSSIFIAAERGTLDLDALLTNERQERFALSAVTASELLHGVHRADTAARRLRREAYVDAIFSTIPILAFDLLAARAHARLSAHLVSAGVTIGAHDLIIAATALSRGMDVVSRDERSFPRIPGLSFKRW